MSAHGLGLAYMGRSRETWDLCSVLEGKASKFAQGSAQCQIAARSKDSVHMSTVLPNID